MNLFRPFIEIRFILIMSLFHKSLSSPLSGNQDSLVFYFTLQTTGDTQANNANKDIMNVSTDLILSECIPTDGQFGASSIGPHYIGRLQPAGNPQDRMNLFPKYLARANGAGNGYDCLSMALEAQVPKNASVINISNKPFEELSHYGNKVQAKICAQEYNMANIVTSPTLCYIQRLICSHEKIRVAYQTPTQNGPEIMKDVLQALYKTTPEDHSPDVTTPTVQTVPTTGSEGLIPETTPEDHSPDVSTPTVQTVPTTGSGGLIPEMTPEDHSPYVSFQTVPTVPTNRSERLNPSVAIINGVLLLSLFFYLFNEMLLG